MRTPQARLRRRERTVALFRIRWWLIAFGAFFVVGAILGLLG